MGAFERITVEVQTDTAEAMRQSVANGLYESPDEMVDLALRDWIRVQGSDDLKLQRLQNLIAEGDASGPSIPGEQAFAGVRARIARLQETR